MVIVVLSDGTTYSELDKCKIVWVADHIDADDIEDILKDLTTATNRGDAEVMAILGVGHA